jgi:membrane-associated phospholipid phosphatase
MFQTDIIIFLQSFASEPLNIAMKAITAIGYEVSFFIILISISSGINFRKGFLLMQILMVTGLINQFFKEFFALPRPWFVDSTLDTFGKTLSTKFDSMDANNFWSGLPQIVVDQYRAFNPDTFGLPSGHTSTALTLWGSIAIIFKHRWVSTISVSLIILIPLSRLYLARHFLADILAGYLLGLIILLLFYFIIYREIKIAKYLSESRFLLETVPKNLFLMTYLVLFPIVAALVIKSEAIEIAGFLLGLNIVYLIICKNEYPSDKGSLKKRILRVLLTLFVFALVGTITTTFINFLFNDDLQIILFIRGFIIIFFGIYLSYYLHKRFNLIDT